MGSTVASGFEPKPIQVQSLCSQPFCLVASRWKRTTEQQPPAPHLYHRVQGRLHGPRLAVVLHQASGHEAEATEQLMGTSAGGDAWGVCRGRRGM